MRVHSSSWLLLSLLALSALVVAEVHFEIGKGPGGQVVGQGSKPAATTPVPLFTLADRDSFSATLERPLFMPNRRTPEAGNAAPAAPTTRATRPNANRYALSAIVIVDDERIALLMDSATGSLNRVREGESVAGWQVEKIDEGSAVLRNGETRAELVLRTFAAPTPRPRSPSRRTRAGEDASTRADEKVPEILPEPPRRPVPGLRQSLK